MVVAGQPRTVAGTPPVTGRGLTTGGPGTGRGTAFTWPGQHRVVDPMAGAAGDGEDGRWQERAVRSSAIESLLFA